MLKVLVKKQFQESFRSYFVDRKTGKARSKGAIIGLFALFGLLMLFLCACFVGMALSMSVLLDTDLNWMYFVIFGIVSIAIGIFGSVFNTYAALYLAKDNDLLLSMPIRPRDILLSRIIMVFGLSLLYSAVVWVPGIAYAYITHTYSPLAVVLGILLTFAIAVFVSVVTCALGWVIAAVSTKIKNKSFITVLMTLLFLGVYYFISFRLSNIGELMIQNRDAVAGGIKTWGNLLYQLGVGATGNVVGFLIFTGVSILLACLTMFILSKSFLKIVTKSTEVKTGKAKITYKSSKSVHTTLLKKELKRFTSSPTYMLNCGLGIVILLGLSVVAIIYGNKFSDLISLFAKDIPEVMKYAPLVVITLVCLTTSMNAVSVPSVSLEGKSLWIIKSLPADTYNILQAKQNFHFYINAIPALIGTVIFGIVLKMDYTMIFYSLAIILVFIRVTGDFGLFLGLKRPNLSWTNEAQPIKQNLSIVIFMFGCWILTAAIPLIYILINDKMEITTYLSTLLCVLVILEILLTKWIKTKGVEEFNNL